MNKRKPRKCPYCQSLLSSSAKYCMVCGAALTFMAYRRSRETKRKFLTNREWGMDSVPSRENPGARGEYSCMREILLVPGTYFVLQNCFIPTGYKKYTEIDILLVHRTGLYVIESKNISGLIFGQRDDYNWTRFTSSNKMTFYNPIRQNEGHIYALDRFIDYPRDGHIQSVVVFGASSELRVPTMSGPGYAILTSMNSVRRELLTHMIRQKEEVSLEQAQTLYRRLEPLCHLTAKEKSDHIARIREN